MPNAAGRVQAITDTVNRYIELVAKGSADDLVELYADDATVEDPVGGRVTGGEGASRAIRL
jgi:steroid Delta-isomerase